MTAIDARSLSGWTPFRAAWREREMLVYWAHLAAKRFTEPFFYETIATVALHPFNQLFGQCTRADALDALPAGLKPSGFVFHMARCGSTLCAQALAASPAHIVMSEPLPVRNILRAPLHGPATPDDVARWLAGMMNALGQPRFPQERRLFVKFMAADALDLPLILRVFPQTPWLFLYRDPLEILASQHAMGGADTIPGAIPTARLGLNAEAIAAMTAQAYQSHVIAALGQAALAAKTDGRGLILNYEDLPRALCEEIPRHFGLALGSAELAAMREAAGRDAKRPRAPFMADGAAKRLIGAQWRDTVDAIAGPTIAALDRARGARG